MIYCKLLYTPPWYRQDRDSCYKPHFAWGLNTWSRSFIYPGWWFGFVFFSCIYWEQSSHLTNIFQRGSSHPASIIMCHVWNVYLLVYPKNQPNVYSMVNISYMDYHLAAARFIHWVPAKHQPPLPGTHGHHTCWAMLCGGDKIWISEHYETY